MGIRQPQPDATPGRIPALRGQGQAPAGPGNRAAGVDSAPNKPNHPICCYLPRIPHYILPRPQWLPGDSGENKANRRGRRPRLRIGDSPVRDTRYASTVWTVRQTKPIRAAEASALMMDYGLSTIWGKAMAVAGGWRSRPPARQTKPNCPFWLRRARLRSGGQGVEIRDTIHEIRGNHVDTARNKANLRGSWAENEGLVKNKANLGQDGRRGRVGEFLTTGLLPREWAFWGGRTG
jgi:hypothetical protein